MISPLKHLLATTDRPLLKEVTHQGRSASAALARMVQQQAEGRHSVAQHRRALTVWLLRLYGPERLFPRLKGGIEHLRIRYRQQLERTLNATGQPVPGHNMDELQQDVL